MSGRGITPDMIAAWELVRESGSTGGDKWKLFAELLGVPLSAIVHMKAATGVSELEEFAVALSRASGAAPHE